MSGSELRLKGLRPMLAVADLRKSIDFYTQVLGFHLAGTWPDDGEIVWAEVVAGESARLMLVANYPENMEHGPKLSGQLYMYPDDIDALWKRLKDKVEVAWPIENMVYGMREFAIRDIDGYTLTFGIEIEEG